MFIIFCLACDLLNAFAWREPSSWLIGSFHIQITVYLWQNQRVNFKSNGISLEFAYKVTYKRKNVSAYFTRVLKLEYMIQKISRYLLKNENCL